MDVLSDCPSDFELNCSDLENDTVSEDGESDIRPPKYQERNIIESHSDDEKWNERDITPNLENYLNIPGLLPITYSKIITGDMRKSLNRITSRQCVNIIHSTMICQLKI